MNRFVRFLEFVWMVLVVIALLLWVLPDLLPRRRRK